MAALQCEICGGKLMAKAGGLFECEYCGMQYDKLRIQEMVQEIKGTVQVEGTVEVKGTVAVDTKASQTNLLKRIAICAEDKDFEKIRQLADELLALDAECSQAYLWQLAARYSCTDLDALFKLPLHDLQHISQSSEWKNAVRYAPEQEGESLKQRMDMQFQYWTKDNPALEKRFRQIQPVQQLLHSCNQSLLALCADGTVRVVYAQETKWVAPVQQWTCVKKLVTDWIYEYVIGLCWDGRVMAVCKPKSSAANLIKDLLRWASAGPKVVDLCADGAFITCLFDDGTIASTKDEFEDKTFYFGYDEGWQDVVQLQIAHVSESNVYGKLWGEDIYGLDAVMVLGITKDGHVRCSASAYDLSREIRNALHISLWKDARDVAKINFTHSPSILYRDGTILAYGHRDQKKKWLDFNLSAIGCIMDGPLPDPHYSDRNFVAVSGYCALQADGTVVRSQKNVFSSFDNPVIEQWTDIVALQDGYFGDHCICVLGLRADGTVLQAWNGDPAPGLSVDGWKLFDCLDTFNEECKTAEENWHKKKNEAQQKIWDSCADDIRETAHIMQSKLVVAPTPNRPFHMATATNGRVFVSCADAFERQTAKYWDNILSLAVGECHALGLRRDGTVVAAGNNRYGQCNVEKWRFVRKVAACGWHSVGLLEDGSLVTCGYNEYGQGEVSQWHDLIDVAVGRTHTVGLKKDGTVVACGLQTDKRCNVSHWENIVKIYAFNNYTIGIKKDGTAVCTHDAFDVSQWGNIVDVATGVIHALGLTADGKVFAAGEDSQGSTKVGDWNNVVAVSTLNAHSVALRADGTVLAKGNDSGGQCQVAGWRNIVAISAGPFITLGVKKDGSVVCAGQANDNKDSYHVSGNWNLLGKEGLFSQYKDIQDRCFACLRAQWEESIIYREKGRCQYCGGELKGLFSKKCVNCGSPKDY